MAQGRLARAVLEPKPKRIATSLRDAFPTHYKPAPLPPDTTYISSTVHLRPSKTAWSVLAEKVHTFSCVCYVDETCPGLLVAFGDVERLHDDFQRRAAIVFNNKRPSFSPRPATSIDSRAPVSIEKAARNVVADWQIFIQQFLAVVSDDIEPFYRLMATRLTFLAQLLHTVSQFFGYPQSTMAMGPLRQAQNVIDNLKYDAVRLSAVALAHGNAGFDLGEYQSKVKFLSSQVADVCHRIIGNNSQIVIDAVGTKRELLAAADIAVKVSQGISLFHPHLEEVANAVLAMNEALQILFTTLGIKETLLQIEETEASTKKTKKKLGPAGSVHRLQKLVVQFEDALNDSSRLFQTQS
jgi:hypothetical protein